MDEQTRLLALAHLQNGKTPSETADIVNISYAQALKLRKELTVAEEKDRVRDLFNLSEATLEILLESVRRQMRPAIEAFGIGELVEENVQTLTNGIEGGKLLQEEFQQSASAIVNRITQVAITSSNAETILSLAKALCELQNAFFGASSAPSSNVPLSSFEQHLQK